MTRIGDIPDAELPDERWRNLKRRWPDLELDDDGRPLENPMNESNFQAVVQDARPFLSKLANNDVSIKQWAIHDLEAAKFCLTNIARVMEDELQLRYAGETPMDKA